MLSALWPRKTRQLKRYLIEDLDDQQFYQLRVLVRSRMRRRFAHPKHIADIERRLIKRRKRRRGSINRHRFYPQQPSESVLLSALCPQRERNWIGGRQRAVGPRVSARTFSFFDNPIETVRTLQKIAYFESRYRSVFLDFEDELITDLAPYVILSLISRDMCPFIDGGKISEPAAKVIEAVGLRDELRMKKFIRTEQFPNIWPIKLRHRRPTGTSKADHQFDSPTTKEKVSDLIVGEIDAWLEQAKPPQMLTQEGKSNIYNIIGEVLDNAESHGHISGDGEWSVGGFAAKRSHDEHDILVGHLCFVNLGRSIAESISDRSSAQVSQLWSFLRAYRSWFGMSHEEMEIFSTLFALQDGNSRRKLEQGSLGGVGLLDVAEFVQGLGELDDDAHGAQVCIVSGGVCIRLAPPYVCGIDVAPGTGRRAQYFNPTNDPRTRPADTHVFRLPCRFPGTVLTCRFALHAEARDDEDVG